MEDLNAPSFSFRKDPDATGLIAAEPGIMYVL